MRLVIFVCLSLFLQACSNSSQNESLAEQEVREKEAVEARKSISSQEIEVFYKLIKEGRNKLVEARLEENPHYIHMVGPRQESVVYWAVLYGRIQILNLLLEYKANVSLASDSHWSPLLEASFKGDFEMVTRLLDSKAHCNQITKEGDTALIWASYLGHASVVEVLLERCRHLNITHKNKEGKTALDYALEKDFSHIQELIETHRQ